MEGHRQQGHRDLLARGQQHVHLPLGRVGVDGGSESGEFIGGVPHRRHHDHQVVALVTTAADALGHGLDALDACHRGSAKFLNQQGHGQLIAEAFAREGSIIHRAHSELPPTPPLPSLLLGWCQ